MLRGLSYSFKLTFPFSEEFFGLLLVIFFKINVQIGALTSSGTQQSIPTTIYMYMTKDFISNLAEFYFKVLDVKYLSRPRSLLSTSCWAKSVRKKRILYSRIIGNKLSLSSFSHAYPLLTHFLSLHLPCWLGEWRHNSPRNIFICMN